MIIPPQINKGSKIRIVSPAGKLSEKKVLPAIKWLEKQGYKVELGKHVFTQHFQFAGTDAHRLEDLQTAFDNPECEVIICSRGGYGTVRIIDQLNFTEFKKYPKWLVGFSDITVLHLCLNRLGFATIHGAMPPRFFTKNGEANENLILLIDLLTGQKINYTISKNEKNKTGLASGELIGGNLSIITSLLGTKYEIETADKILFLEETDEYLYRIDRMIYQLKLAGKLNKLAGLIVGNFTNIKDNDSPFGQTVEAIILDAVKDFGFPVCFDFPGGHNKKNLALAFGTEWKLDVSSEGTTLNFQLKWLQPAK